MLQFEGMVRFEYFIGFGFRDPQKDLKLNVPLQAVASQAKGRSCV